MFPFPDAQRLELESAFRSELEVRWRRRLESLLSDLESSKASVQALMRDNQRMRADMARVADEGNRQAEEAKVKAKKRVRFNNH